MEKAHKDLAQTPYASVFYDNCIVTAKDMSAGGAEYNHCGPQGSGIATVADSMTAIDQLVFQEKKCTGKELLDADYADQFAVFAFDTYCKHIEEREYTWWQV